MSNQLSGIDVSGHETPSKVLKWGVFFRDSKSWIGIGISVFFIVLIARQIHYDQLRDTFSTIQRWPILPALFIYFCGVYLRALRWQILLAPLKLIPSHFQFKVVCLGYMANNILPFRAGEFYRAHIMGQREGIARTAVFSSIILERVCDGLVMLFFLGTSTFFLQNALPIPFQMIMSFSLLFFGGLFIVFLVMVWNQTVSIRLFTRLTNLLPQRISAKFSDLFEHALSGLASLKGIKTSAAVFFLSVLSWLCEAAMYYFLFFSMDIDLSYEVSVLLVAVINLGIMIPSSPGYVGTFEYFCILTLTFFHIPYTVAFSYSLFLHFLLFLPITCVGFYYFWILSVRPASVETQRLKKEDNNV
ncbi:flippase-like domain-containing protein [bacterium]|nr:flippase-like domain-containing protein [bacterium]